MKLILSKLLKSVFTPKMVKQMFITLGDHLVKSSKNKLDDAIWAKVKDKI
jgi:hypothetical protein